MADGIARQGGGYVGVVYHLDLVVANTGGVYRETPLSCACAYTPLWLVKRLRELKLVGFEAANSWGEICDGPTVAFIARD